MSNQSFSVQVIMGDRPAAERACKDPNPIIDGRKANVNLAILGAKPRGNIQPGKYAFLADVRSSAFCLLSTQLVICSHILFLRQHFAL